ncbi:uncharacterized protein EDB91DRAFT_1057805 [Suillus paluster]|uniref:uncharacterized protein n=1 Tax=Suillus paluster TaxID=48578 RepID=UPI001B862FC2|nr:uncharacterized protein EDB91DRAFT_1057805 [Suillus paluster]KAG1732927.1 hypothetical protein EDB91DRAFT_1057805 [Suillus paluster]
MSSPSRPLNNIPHKNDQAQLLSTFPSDGWLHNPAWIDGGVNPPHFYVSHEQIKETQRVALAAGARPMVPPASLPAVIGIPPIPPVVQAEVVLSGPSDHSGHLVSATMLFSAPKKASGICGKIAMKKTRMIKTDHVRIDTITRVDFIQAFLRIHELSDQYSPGAHTGPKFKIWWTGSSGGKTGASTVDNNHDFTVAHDTLLKKRKATCTVSVEFDLDAMEGFRTRKRPISHVDAGTKNEELLYGTKVPRVDIFSDEVQLNGAIILQLKAKWTYEKHSGEHGESGHCYVSAMGEHVGLNHRKLKLWAAAIAAADATKHKPPNTVDFNGLCDGRIDAMKSCGHNGPRLSSSSSPDPTTALLAAVTSLITSQLASKATLEPSTPTHHCPRAQTPFSPIPATGTEIHLCLSAFLQSYDVDLMGSEDVLSSLELTPDIIGDMPVTCLCNLPCVVEGRAMKFQGFAREWSNWLKYKKHQRE